MADTTCSIDGCERGTDYRGMCQTHYKRWLACGDPLQGLPIQHYRPRGLDVMEAFSWYMPGDPPITDSLVEGCWFWTGRTDGYGYGTIQHTVNGVRSHYVAHRLSYELHVGPVPSGLLVRHTCDTPPCCQPKHLLIGTHADNTDDKVSRNRQSRGITHSLKTRGEKSPHTQLTESDVHAIRKLASQGMTQYALAARFGCSQPSINLIVRRKRWAHI